EIRRNDGHWDIVSDTTFSDYNLDVGTYSYRVRAVGGTLLKGKRLNHVSDWSAPVQVTIKSRCPQAPTIAMVAQATQRTYRTIPSLRMHLRGQAEVPPGCTLTQLNYKIESDAAITHSGPLHPDAQGHFDETVDAIRREDEVPTGSASF